MRIAVTGAAGLVGAKVAAELLQRDHEVLGIDIFDSTYLAQLKQDRIRRFAEEAAPGMDARHAETLLMTRGA